MADLDSKIVVEGDRLFEEFKGAITENYVLNMLSIVYDNVPSYFTFDRYEIDFVIQVKNEIIPIEVKSGKNAKHYSLTNYNEKYNCEKSVILSLNNLSENRKNNKYTIIFNRIYK